jgi:hypothetical protein
MCVISKSSNIELMSRPKIKCLFVDILKREYPFIIDDELDANKVRFTLYKSIFSISNFINDIEKEGTHRQA